ncbi:MAG TPA: tRNA pseudouridine synthase A [Nannocystaceae bacterium]|nr:tRNA pseudouridine synthase A [Nannocystaceae bacterium]
MSILLRVAYDGTDFHGFARQPGPAGGEPLRTVQGELERVLAFVHRAPVETRGASRTDAGVHARGQLVAFERTLPIPCAGLRRAVTKLLPADAAVLAAWEEEGDGGGPVDLRRDNLGKRYRYRVRCTPDRDPIGGRFEWHHGKPLDTAAMQEASARLVGTHDFASFRSSACQAKTTVRTIRSIDVCELAAPLGVPGDRGHPRHGGPDVVEIRVDGLAFLHNMVRIIAGTLVEVGLGRRTPSSIDALLAASDRRAAGRTAPASGLTLDEVIWGDS